jgi:acylphosphatase
MERRQIRFEGRVQGVGFRATARAVAAGFAVTGWVRNEADGSVMSEVQGAAGQINAYLAALRARMGRNITGETAAPMRPAAGESGFEVRR